MTEFGVPPLPIAVCMAANSRGMRRVAIIGAGAAGLCCARHFTRELNHFDIQVFEKSYSVGGTWMFCHETAPHPVHSSVYKNLRHVYYDKEVDFIYYGV